MKVEYIDINKIIPYKNNPRKNESAIDGVAESIKEFGFKVPIVVNKEFEIITGHTRLEAAKRLKLKKVPIIIAKDLSKEKEKAFRLADNKTSEFASWDEVKLEEELEEIKNIDMQLYNFIKEEKFDWNDIEDIDEDNYDEPEHKMLECPYCHHKDRYIHFKKVK